jgi:Helicase HerA, central domain
MSDPGPGLDAHVGQFRDVRRQLEEAVLPLATSVDGRRFSFQAPLRGLELQPGGYAAIEDDGSRRLGQVLDVEVAHMDGPELGREIGEAADAFDLRSRTVLRLARGSGVVLDGQSGPFHDASIHAAAPDAVSAWIERTQPGGATLTVGELALVEGVPLALAAGGFDRHTFLCGQSGSGKTYALGTILEQLLLETTLRIVVLDPNSDFVRLTELREGVDEGLADRYREATSGVVVRRAAERGTERLRLRFAELDPQTQAAVLRLDPINDRDEYSDLVQLLEQTQTGNLPPTPEALRDLLAREAPVLGRRIQNLGVDRWELWAAGDEGSLLDELGGSGPRCLVIDLGSLPTREEQHLTAAAVLGHLWERRAEREPMLVVLDEAHNVCPQVPEGALLELATEHAVRIAGEGRKYGLYLLVVTQRPQKVHENVVSQCDNLALMRMNSLADLNYVGEVFSHAPRGLLERAVAFRQGEALFAGKLVSHPTLGRIGARLSEEGGSDVEADWARAPGSHG